MTPQARRLADWPAALLACAVLALFLAACGDEPTGAQTPGPTVTATQDSVHVPSVAKDGPLPTATATAEGPGEAPVLWERSFGEGYYALPAVDDARVYVSVGSSSLFEERDSYVTALDLVTGEPLWRFDTTDIPFVPTVEGATVYVGSGDGTIYALDTETGEERWRQPVNAIPFVLTVDEVRVFVSTVDPETYSFDGIVDLSLPDEVSVLDAASGDSLWTQPIECLQGFLVPGDELAYLATDCRREGQIANLVAVNPATGATVWSTPTGSAHWPPAVSGVSVYVAAADDIISLDAATGTERWRAQPPNGGGYFRPSIVDGVVYANSNTHSLDALDADTGETIWSTFYPDCSGYQFPVGDMFYATSCGYISAMPLDAAPWDEKPAGTPEGWVFDELVGGISPPAIDDGVLVFGDRYSGTVVAFDVS